MAPELMLYGATGYSLGLAAIEAKRVGLEFIIGGRNETKVKALASSFDTLYRVFSPDDSLEAVDKALQGVRLFANGAGPFQATSGTFMDACIRNKVHYIDISAELNSFRDAAKRDHEAQAAGIMLMPAACSGVESIMDCVGARLLEKVKSPVGLTQVLNINGPVSRGTLATIRGFTDEVVSLVDGELVPHVAEKTIIDFRDGSGVSHECFPSNDPQMVTLEKAKGLRNFSSYCAKTGGDFPVSDINEVPEGPSEEERADFKYHVHFTATAEDKSALRAVVHMANGYDLTALGTVKAAQRILGGQVEIKPGFQTPFLVFGGDYPEAFPGTVVKEY